MTSQQKTSTAFIEEEQTAQQYEQIISKAYSGEITRMLLLGGSPKLRSKAAIWEAEDGSLQVVLLETPQVIDGNTDVLRENTAYSMEELYSALNPKQDELGILYAVLSIGTAGMIIVYYGRKRYA